MGAGVRSSPFADLIVFHGPEERWPEILFILFLLAEER
jgi:hypothetical protein